MTKRFMLMLVVDTKTDAGYISLVPRSLQPAPGCAQSDVSFRRVEIPGRRVGTLPALYADYGAGGRIVGVGICKPSECLSERFQSRERKAEFPVYMTVDYTAESARIAFRERCVEVFFNNGGARATVCVREIPAVPAGTLLRKRMSYEYDAAGKLTAVSIADITNQLLTCYLPSSMTEK